MGSPNTYKQNKDLPAETGFSLVEIIIVLAIITLLISFATVVDFSAFQTETLESEKSTIVTLLQKARSRALANFFDSSQGVCYLAPHYIIFRASEGNCVEGESTNELIPANTNLTVTFPAVVFNRLTANSTDTVIHITDGVKEVEIEINNAGAINW